jgi:hypothetical protein
MVLADQNTLRALFLFDQLSKLFADSNFKSWYLIALLEHLTCVEFRPIGNRVGLRGQMACADTSSAKSSRVSIDATVVGGSAP